jgi:hypothetical protein
MNVTERIFWSFEVVIGAAVIFLSIIYSIPILFIRRFHHHILTFNVCLATIVSSASWIYFYTTFQLNTTYMLSQDLCAFLIVIQMMCTLQVPFSFVAVSIHRFCVIVNNRNTFFKTKQWILTCIVVQWMLGILLSLLTLFQTQLVRF